MIIQSSAELQTGSVDVLTDLSSHLILVASFSPQCSHVVCRDTHEVLHMQALACTAQNGAMHKAESTRACGSSRKQW